MKHDGCDVIGAGYGWLSREEDERERTYYLTNVRLRVFDKRPFNLPDMKRRMGLMGLVVR